MKGKLFTLFAAFVCAGAFSIGCDQIPLLNNADEEAQAEADLMVLAAAYYVANQKTSTTTRTCAITQVNSTTTVTETLYNPVTSGSNIFTGDDARATSAVYFVFDGVSAGETWTVRNFAIFNANQGEGTIDIYSGNSCPLSVNSTSCTASSSYAGGTCVLAGATGNGSATSSTGTTSNNSVARTITFNTAGPYIVQFYTGTGVGTSNGANATLAKN